MVGWHHRLNGHEFEQTLGDSEGQGSLVCGSPWGHKEWSMTEQLNNNNWIISTSHAEISLIHLFKKCGFDPHPSVTIHFISLFLS